MGWIWTIVGLPSREGYATKPAASGGMGSDHSPSRSSMSDTAMGCYHSFFSPSTRASFLRGDFETHFEWPAAQVNDSRLLLKRHSYQSCKRHCPLVALQWLLLPTTVQLRQAKTFDPSRPALRLSSGMQGSAHAVVGMQGCKEDLLIDGQGERVCR